MIKRKEEKRGSLNQARALIYFCCRVIVYSAVAVGVIWIVIDAVLYFGASRDFTVRKIVISGTHWATREEIQQLADLRIGTNIWFVPSTRVAQQIARHPWVRFCRVDKIPPDRISIFVEERQPVCALLDRRQGVLYGLDADSVVLPVLFSPHPNPKKPVPPERLAAVRRLPFLTGPATVVVPGRPIEDKRYRTVLDLLINLRRLSLAFLDHIQSIHITDAGWIEMFPTRYVERILFPSSIPETLPQQIVRIWNLIEKEQIDMEYIDARFPRAGIALRPRHLDPGRWYALCRRANRAA